VDRVKLRAVSRAICLDRQHEHRDRASAPASFEALRQEHLLILKAAGEGIYGLDLEGRASFVNPAAAALTGHSVEKLIEPQRNEGP
jgi:PAS domain-containing protein